MESEGKTKGILNGLPGRSIFRILVPMRMEPHLGSAFPLKALEKYEEIKAQIKFIVGPLVERMVMVSAEEVPDSPLPPAVDGLLRVHRFFLNWLHDGWSLPIPEGKFSTILIVPAVQVSSLINSSTISSTEQECSCKIEIYEAVSHSSQHSGSEPGLPGYPALRDDLIVDVIGKSEDVHKAVESIASHLRKFSVDRSIIPTIEMQYCLLEKPPHHGISLYGREASMLACSSSNRLAESEAHLSVEILRLYADAILGREGANIKCMRRLTGATFTVKEIQKVPDQILVVIDGYCSQVRKAEQLMLMFIAEAGGPQSTDSLYKSRLFGTSSCLRSSYLKPSLAKQTGGKGSSACGTLHLQLNSK